MKCTCRSQFEEVPGNEAFADEMEKAMTYYTLQSLFGGDVDLRDAYDWKSAKVRLILDAHLRPALKPKCGH